MLAGESQLWWWLWDLCFTFVNQEGYLNVPGDGWAVKLLEFPIPCSAIEASGEGQSWVAVGPSSLMVGASGSPSGG